MNKRPPFNFQRVIRKLVEIDCPGCSYPRGVKNEHDEIKCGMCGEMQNAEKNAVL